MVAKGVSPAPNNPKKCSKSLSIYYLQGGNAAAYLLSKVSLLYHFITWTHLGHMESMLGHIVAIHDPKVNGKKTLGENIADNGGVREAFGALREHLAKVGPEPKLPGFENMTSEQLFFLSFGNVSFTKYRISLILSKHL